MPDYELIRDFDECARRCEIQPSAFLQLKRIPGVPPEMVQRFEELYKLTWNVLKRLDREELSKRVQAQKK